MKVTIPIPLVIQEEIPTLSDIFFTDGDVNASYGTFTGGDSYSTCIHRWRYQRGLQHIHRRRFLLLLIFFRDRDFNANFNFYRWRFLLWLVYSLKTEISTQGTRPLQ
jgi:hypothetical protein